MEAIQASVAPVRPAIRLTSPTAPIAAEYLSFRLGAEEYGIEILAVQEIRSYQAPTRIANAPPCIQGVINLRGVIVPIVDLRLRFGLVEVPSDLLTAIVVLNVAQRVVGLVVDAVSDVLQIPDEQVQPAPSFVTTIDAGFITGIGTLPGGASDRMLVLLDVARLLSPPDLGLIAGMAG